MRTRSGLWTMLEFSELGFIGKLFKSSNLPLLSRYMTMFYVEQPVDWLMNYFRLSMGQRTVYLRKPTLFQHIGLKSSFDITKDNPLKDKFFDSGDKPYLPDNPPAFVFSQIPHFETHTVDLAYGSGSGFFWGTSINTNDTIFVIFEEDQHLTKIIVETGNDQNPKDQLVNGSVLISGKVSIMNQSDKTAVCDDPEVVAVFKDGRAIVEALTDKITRCLMIRVDSSQTKWVVFSQIAVFLKK
jgi:alpha-1,3-mannosylglycoprotein beta-1,4-N-acetylglucosaminyltransferase C